MGLNVGVVGFAFKGDQVVLIRKSRPEWQAGKLNGIGGKVEYFESPSDAMHRECLEETGVPVDWVHRGVIHYADYELVVYTGEWPRGRVPAQMTDEHVALYDVDAILQKPHELIYNLPWLLRMLKHVQTFDIRES